MAVRRNHGPLVGPKPLLLDRARRAKPVRVLRRKRPLYRSPLVVAFVVGAGALGVLRYTGYIDTTALLKAAPFMAPAEVGSTPKAAVLSPVTRPALKLPGFAMPDQPQSATPRAEHAVSPGSLSLSPAAAHTPATTQPAGPDWSVLNPTPANPQR